MRTLSKAAGIGRIMVLAAIGWLGTACNHDTSDAGPRAAAAVAAIALQSDEFKPVRDARLLPVELEYRVLEPTRNRAATLELTLHTALATGVLDVDIIASPGTIAGAAAQRRLDLASAPRPLLIELELAPLPSSTVGQPAVPRVLTIEVATRQGKASQARVFRIVLPASKITPPVNPSG